MVEKLEPKLVLRIFFQLKAHMEDEHYLLFYRLRIWFSGSYQIVVEDPLQRSGERIESVDLAANSFKQMILMAKSQFFEDADDELIAVGDLRCRIEPKLGC